MARRRSSRAISNDAAIRAAAIELVLQVGVDAISFRDVGRVAGLTHGALYARFEDVEELLVDLWNEVLCHRAIDLLEVVVRAVSDPNEATVRAVVDRLRDTPNADIAMVEVLLTSRRFEVLHEEVESFIHDYLESNELGVTGAVQSRSLVLLALLMVEILASAQFGLRHEDLTFLETVVLESLKVPAADVGTLVMREPWDRRIQPPADDFRSQLAFATFEAVGKSGYARATISRISRRSNCSPGAIYKVYPSKEDLVIDAIRGVMEAPWITIASFADILEVGSLAQLLYAAASEQNSVRKYFTLEAAIAAAHSDKLRDAVHNQVRSLEGVVPLIHDISDEECDLLRDMIRSIVFLTLGVSFLSTVTSATDLIDFNLFAEPLRRTLLTHAVRSWDDIRSQLLSLAGPSRSPVA